MYFYSEKRLVSKIPSSFHFLGLEKREGSVQKIYAVQAVKKQLYLGESERKFRKVNRGTRKLGSKSPSSMVGSELNLSAHERRRTIDLTCLIEAFSYRRRRLFSSPSSSRSFLSITLIEPSRESPVDLPFPRISSIFWTSPANVELATLSEEPATILSI